MNRKFPVFVFHCAFFLVLMLIVPVGVSAATSNEITLNIDPPEFTLIEDSIGCGYYIPWYSHIHWSLDGTATLTLPNATIIHLNPHTQGDPTARVSRIVELPNGASAFPGDNNLTATYDGEHILWISWDPDISTTPNPNHPTPAAAGMISPSWVEWATITPPAPTQYQSFATKWKVPEKPTKTELDLKNKLGSVFFIFNGFESKTGAVLPTGFQPGIVQPILIWNCGEFKQTAKTCTGYPKDETWRIAAWADFKTTSVHSQLFSTQPGHTIVGRVEWSSKTSTWTITVTDQDGGQMSQLPNIRMIPNDSNLIEPVICLENYQTSLICNNGDSTEQWPQSVIVFTDFELKNTNNNDITKQSTIFSDYNKLRFMNRNVGNNCSPLDNTLPTYDKEHYYVYTNNWPDKVIFQTPAKIATKEETKKMETDL